MARYTCSYRFPVSLTQIYSVIAEILESCQLKADFESRDYIMAKEIVQDVPFFKIVKIDILINLASSDESQTTIDIVVKNEELALSQTNQALTKLAAIKKVIAENYQAELL